MEGSKRVVTTLDFLEAGAPAVFGGEPAFDGKFPLADPSLLEDDARAVSGEIENILRSGVLTNGPHVRELEVRTAEYLGVRDCVAVSSCTAGLMLALRASELTGDVVVPSFTFAATAHAVDWNGLRPLFADVDPETLTLSPRAAQHGTGVRTSAILATHVYGTPCDVEGLADVADRNGLKLFFDAAHAFGSIHNGRKVGGFGDAEVFSLSPTKVLVAGEGGIVATNNDVLAERLRIGRDYGNPGDYDCLYVGLNARMSEMHAAIALKSLETIEERINRRNEIARLYREALGDVPGISFPRLRPGDRSTYKDFTIVVNAERFGMGADDLAAALETEGIETRRYYSPAVHAMRSYRTLAPTTRALPATDAAAASVLSLPLWIRMTDEDIDRIAWAISRINRFEGGRRAG